MNKLGARSRVQEHERRAGGRAEQSRAGQEAEQKRTERLII